MATAPAATGTQPMVPLVVASVASPMEEMRKEMHKEMLKFMQASSQSAGEVASVYDQLSNTLPPRIQ